MLVQRGKPLQPRGLLHHGRPSPGLPIPSGSMRQLVVFGDSYNRPPFEVMFGRIFVSLSRFRQPSHELERLRSGTCEAFGGKGVIEGSLAQLVGCNSVALHV